MLVPLVRQTIRTCRPSGFRAVIVKVQASKIGFRLAKGTFWSWWCGDLAWPHACRCRLRCPRVGQDAYGELGIIQSTVGMFGVFASFSLGLTATKHVAEFRRSDPAAGRIIGLLRLIAIASGGIMALGLFLFAGGWRNTRSMPRISVAFFASAPILFLSAINGAQTGALTGFEAFKTIAYVNLLVGLCSFPILLGGAYFGGLAGTVWALLINLGINWLLNYWALPERPIVMASLLRTGIAVENYPFCGSSVCRPSSPGYSGDSRSLGGRGHFGESAQRLCRNGGL